MDGTSREARITAAFVTVADTLTTNYDIVELLHTLVEECSWILGTTAGGLLLADGSGHLQVMTTTSEAADIVEIMQLAADSGPCIDCFTTGLPVSVPDIGTDSGAWPEFRAAALAQGFRMVHATPMKLRGQVIGTMNLFGPKPTEVSVRDIAVVQALADVATIGILQERLIREGHLAAEQLHRALDSRILIEQAKGVVANSQSLSMDRAFEIIRTYTRSRNLTLRDVAEAISSRTITVESLLAGTARS
jgi:GAF domain-containing protein